MTIERHLKGGLADNLELLSNQQRLEFEELCNRYVSEKLLKKQEGPLIQKSQTQTVADENTISES